MGEDYIRDNLGLAPNAGAPAPSLLTPLAHSAWALARDVRRCARSGLDNDGAGLHRRGRARRPPRAIGSSWWSNDIRKPLTNPRPPDQTSRAAPTWHGDTQGPTPSSARRGRRSRWTPTPRRRRLSSSSSDNLSLTASAYDCNVAGRHEQRIRPTSSSWCREVQAAVARLCFGMVLPRRTPGATPSPRRRSSRTSASPPRPSPPPGRHAASSSPSEPFGCTAKGFVSRLLPRPAGTAPTSPPCRYESAASCR